MCESSVYLMEGGEERLVAKEVILMRVTDEGVTFVDIAGTPVTLRNVVVAYVDFVNHKVVLEKAKGGRSR